MIRARFELPTGQSLVWGWTTQAGADEGIPATVGRLCREFALDARDIAVATYRSDGIVEGTMHPFGCDCGGCP